MTNQIATLNQAESKLRELGAVNVSPTGIESVDGITLLDSCGYEYLVSHNGYQKNQAKKVVDRQIAKHNFIEGVDYISRKVGRSTEYRFSLNAANHILLAAMTTQGKTARQQAIDLANHIQASPLAITGSKGAYLGVAKLMSGVEDAKRTKWKEALRTEIANQGVINAVNEFIETTSSKSCNGLIKVNRAELLRKAKAVIKAEQKQYGINALTNGSFNTADYEAYTKAQLLISERRELVMKRHITELATK
jgi:phage anti-repressor protein